MGVYVAEAQRAKSILQHSMQSRAAQADQVPCTQYDAAVDSQTGYDSPEYLQQNQAKSNETQPAVAQTSHSPPSQNQLSQSGTDKKVWIHDHSCSSVTTAQTASVEGSEGEGHPQHGGQAYATGAMQVQHQLQAVSHQMSYHPHCHNANQELQLEKRPAAGYKEQQGSNEQTCNKPSEAALEYQGHESHLQLDGQPMSHVQQALSHVFQSCQGDGPEAGEVSRFQLRGQASPNAAKFGFARSELLHCSLGTETCLQFCFHT